MEGHLAGAAVIEGFEPSDEESTSINLNESPPDWDSGNGNGTR